MLIEQNKSLRLLNTFHIDSAAKYFAEVMSIEGFQELISDPKFKEEKKFILGSGSNILLTKNIDGLVIRNSVPGIEILNEDAYNVWIKVGAGELWHRFV